MPLRRSHEKAGALVEVLLVLPIAFALLVAAYAIVTSLNFREKVSHHLFDATHRAFRECSLYSNTQSLACIEQVRTAASAALISDGLQGQFAISIYRRNSSQQFVPFAESGSFVHWSHALVGGLAVSGPSASKKVSLLVVELRVTAPTALFSFPGLGGPIVETLLM